MLIKFFKGLVVPIIYLTLLFNVSFAYAVNPEIEIDLDVDQLVREKVEEKSEISSEKYNHEEVQKTIDDASVNAKKNAKEAKKSLIAANKIVQKSQSSQMVEIAKNRAIIEQSRKDIAKMQLLLTSNIRNTNENLDKISSSLKEVESEYVKQNLALADLKELYVKTVSHWRVLVDKSLKFFTQKGSDFDIAISNPKDIYYRLPNDFKDETFIKQYNDSYQSLLNEYDNILKLRIDLNNANKNYQSKLLLRSGRIRSDILHKIISLDEDFISYDNAYADDLIRELKLIPYRPIAIFYSKTLKYKEVINSGFVGFIYILKQISLLGLLIVILFISKNALAKLTNLFNRFSQICFKRSVNDQSYKRLAALLAVISPYFKWLTLLLIFFLSDFVLKNTIFSELAVFIPYFQYFFLYKIFRIYAHFNLNNLVYKNFEEHGNRTAFNLKIRKTTKLLGSYFLSSVCIVHLTQSVVRQAYFYHLTVDIFVIGLIVILALAAARWKSEIKIISKAKFPKKFHTIIDRVLLDRIKPILFSLVILCLIVVQTVISKIINVLRDYDFFKNILSQIYRKRLESAAKRIDYEQEVSVHDSYQKEFSKLESDQNFIRIKDHPYQEMQDIIDNWQSGKSEESSVAIHSEKGIGKSKFLEKIAMDNDNIAVVQVKFDRKVTSKADFVKIISSHFAEEIEEENLFKFLSTYDKKTIITLDDCHNLFLAKENGFEALQTFFSYLVKIDNPNLLWISTFGSFPWNYLQHSLKVDKYFRYILRLPRWSDENIRDLIINKHHQTGFKLIYDPLIFSIHTTNSEKEFEDLQLKFFQIIWSQSRGNPTISIFLWLSCANQIQEKTIKVSLPAIAKSNNLNSLSDDHLFVYGSIIKHQNLSIREISDILSVTRGEVLNIVRIGLERDYLVESSIKGKRFSFSPQWQIAMNKLLINRNFIYEQ